MQITILSWLKRSLCSLLTSPRFSEKRSRDNMELIRCENNICSFHKYSQIPIRLRNLTDHCVDVLSINYSGGCMNHCRLNHNDFVNINTCETNPWIAVNVKTKNRLLIDKQFIYMLKPWREVVCHLYPNMSINDIPPNHPRLTVSITTPMLSLRQRSLLELRSHLKSVDDVNLLGLPKELADDLKLLIRERERFPFVY